MSPDEISEIQQRGVKFAHDYIVKNFQGQQMTEVSLAVNAAAHGYYMGWVYRKKKKERFFFPWTKAMSEVDLRLLSGKAAVKHIGRKVYGFYKLQSEIRVMMIALIAYGFKVAVRDYEADV